MVMDRLTERSWDRAARELLRRIPGLGVPRPAYGGRSIVNVASSAFTEAGGKVDGAPPLAPPLDPKLTPGAGRTAEGPTVVFLIDGLGWHPFRRWVASSEGPLAERWGAAAHPITSVFPTTTSTALTSLSTATAPSVHGLVGYRQYLPRFGVVADMLKFSPVGVSTPELLVGPGWKPSDVSGAPTVFRRGGLGTAVTRDRFQGSGLTRMLYDGAEFVGYATATDFAHELERVLARDHAPRLVYAYWDELDTIQHLKGLGERLFDLELERIGGILEFVARGLSPARRRAVRVMITGDHGQVPATVESRIAIERIPAVADEMGRPLAGDRRAGLFQARPGRLSALRDALRSALPVGSAVLEVPDAVTAGLFGPPPMHPEILDRLGDLLALVPPPAALTYLLPGAAPPTRYLVGAHGGLSAEELLVPLIAGSLAELTGRGRASRAVRRPKR